MPKERMLREWPVNGHIESHYSVKTGKWTDPEFVEDPFLRLHGMAPGLNYGKSPSPYNPEYKRLTLFPQASNATRA